MRVTALPQQRYICVCMSARTCCAASMRFFMPPEFLHDLTEFLNNLNAGYLLAEHV